MEREVIDDVVNLLVGRRLISAITEGGFLQIDFGGPNLSVGCAWRASYDKSIIGSGSDGRAAPTQLRMLIGKAVENVEVIGEFGDLRIVFENGAAVETFCDSGEYESWTLKGVGIQLFISGPGSSWSAF